jgi:5,10-methylenetetrahydromethanopterin reductase
VSRAGAATRVADACERAGWDGLLLGDSQNRYPEVWVELATAAAATTTLRLGTGVTNPITRDSAVTAAAAGTLQMASRGRVVLGIGRGDSSVAEVGQPPASVSNFESYVAQVRAYLHGEEVDRHGSPSRLSWIGATDVPPVPIDVAASGPRSIAIGARHADRITFSVGADITRLRACLREAHRTSAVEKRRPQFGAYLTVAVGSNAEEAAALVRGTVAAMRRLLPEHHRLSIADPMHGSSASPDAVSLSVESIRNYAVVGSARECTIRLRDIVGLGISHLAIILGSDADPATIRASTERFEADVMPAIQSAA